MNPWHDLPSGPRPPSIIHVIIEIPGKTRNKYEFDHDGGYIRLNRVLSSTLFYPADYGLIPRTFYEDGDPLDALVLINEPTFPGCVITARTIGVFRMLDQGDPDDKILAVVDNDPYFQEYRDLVDVPRHLLREITHFFERYKDLEGKRVEPVGWEPRNRAMDSITHAMSKYQELYANAAKH